MPKQKEFSRKDNEEKLKKFIAREQKNKNLDIFTSDGKISVSKVVREFKKETGITFTRQTVSKYLKKDLSRYIAQVDFSQNIKIKEINDAMMIAESVYNDESEKANDRAKALNAWRQLNEQKIRYEQYLRELEIRQVEAGRPNWLLKFKPTSAEHTCPKCNHKFYEGVEKVKEKKELFFKVDNNQSTLDDGEEKDEKTDKDT